MPAFKKVKKNHAGRPTSLTPDLIDRICNALRAGAYIETAVVVSGVPKSVFYDWCKRAYDSNRRKKSNIYAQLLDAVEKAQEECTMRDLMVIDKAANGHEGEYLRDDDGNIVFTQRGNPVMKKTAVPPDWSAAAWRMQRRRPKEWGNTEKVQITGKDDGPVETSQETAEQREKRLATANELIESLADLKGR